MLKICTNISYQQPYHKLSDQFWPELAAGFNSVVASCVSVLVSAAHSNTAPTKRADVYVTLRAVSCPRTRALS
jgi:hypothetical protein